MDELALSGLYGLRVAPLGWAEVAAALALGLLIAWLIGSAVMAFRARPRPEQLPMCIAAARALPAVDRSMVLCGLLKELTERQAPGAGPWSQRAVAAFGIDRETARRLADLYRPGPLPDPELLERAVLTASRR